MRSLALGVLLVSTGTAAADDEESVPLEVHGFVSQGALLTSDNNYLAETTHGSLEFSEAGINVTKIINDRLRAGVQLFSRDLGPIGDYKLKLDWAYFDYHWRDWLGLRAGRIKLPFGLYNDVSDIDAALPTALLPQSVYPATNRDYLLAQTGVELYGYHRFDDAGALDYRLYGGTIYLDFPQQSASPFLLQHLTIPYVAGGRLLWETPIDGLRVGASVQTLKLETSYLDQRDPTMPGTLAFDLKATLGIASIEYVRDAVSFVAEVSKWRYVTKSNDQMLVPDSDPDHPPSDLRAYVLASYRATPRFLGASYYSVYYPYRAPGMPKGVPSEKQHDAAATLRIDLAANWLLKLEAHYMRGTAGLSQTLNPEHSLDSLANRWLLFVAKTTVYF